MAAVVRKSSGSDDIQILSSQKPIAIGEQGTVEISRYPQAEKAFSVAVYRYYGAEDLALRKFVLATDLFPSQFIPELRHLVVEYCYSFTSLKDHLPFNVIAKADEKENFVDRIVVAPLVYLSELSKGNAQLTSSFNIAKWTDLTVEAVFTSDTCCSEPFSCEVSSPGPNVPTLPHGKSPPVIHYYKKSSQPIQRTCETSWEKSVSSSGTSFMSVSPSGDIFGRGIDFLLHAGKKWIIVTLLPVAVKSDETVESKVRKAFERYLAQFALIQAWASLQCKH